MFTKLGMGYDIQRDFDSKSNNILNHDNDNCYFQWILEFQSSLETRWSYLQPMKLIVTLKSAGLGELIKMHYRDFRSW